jgi:SAM-dependent methyltransferase
MHLDDPSAVLTEMRRVVRPGGRVVVAEPDWASIIIDSVDHSAMESLIRQANTVRRQPYVGRELNRRMGGVGLIDRQIETVPIFSLDYGELVAYGLDLSQAADALAAAGHLDRQRAQLLIGALEIASRQGTFCAFGGYFVACGAVPSTTELV